MNDFYEKLQDILISFLGEPKHKMSSNYQLEFSCPRCRELYGSNEDRKFNLSVNLYKQKFQCWKCCSSDDEMKGNISKLIKLYGNTSIYEDYCRLINDARKSKLYQLELAENNIVLDEDILFDVSVSLPQMYSPFVEGKWNPKMPLQYLMDRGIGWDIINKFNIGYTLFDIDHKELSTRIILPSHDEYGCINYWTGRDYSGYKGKQKYLNPKVERKDIIFDEDKISWDADITLVEGPFDHIVVPNSIPLLGKSLKPDFEIYKKLMLYANANVNIFIDGDAYKDALKLYKTLNQGRLRGKIRYIPVNKDLDPSDINRYYGKKGICEHLSRACKIKDIYLI
jgi:hypothetical protein